MKTSKLKIKLISTALTAAMAFTAAAPSLTASAYNWPDAFWTADSSYSAAVASGNYADIIKYGQQVVDMLIQEQNDPDVQNTVKKHLIDMGYAAYAAKDYDTALKCFQQYVSLPYYKEDYDGAMVAENFVKQLTKTLDVYKYTTTEQKYYGAKNEPHGVLLGEVSETPQKDDSMVLLYIEYGDSNFDWPNVVFKDARAKGQTVELALNYMHEGDDARSISASDGFLTNLKNLLNSYSDVPVLLRIGAEVNIWGNACTPDEFIHSFKEIASVLRPLPNVATVFSVAHTSDWNRHIADFYPGDDYVDWVGVMTYPSKYFLGQTWEGNSAYNEVVFKTGYSADPVLAVKETIDLFGDRKPIMISECGSMYYTKGNMNERYPEWGVEQLKNIYALIPMVYPQVKLIAYFDTLVEAEISYCDLGGCPELKDAYMQIKQSPWFIKGASTNSAETYFEKVYDTISTTGTVTLGAYPRLFGSDTITVDYYIDGAWAASSHEAPYSATLTVPDGAHTLKVVAAGNNGASMEKTYNLLGNGASASDIPAQGVPQPDPVEPVNDVLNDIAGLSDVQRSAITEAVGRGIVRGYEDNTFRPMNTITRAEFTTMICSMMGYSADKDCSFSDAATHWASKYIQACVDAGAISGVGNNLFAPDNNVTLEQAVKIITIVANMASPTASYPDGFIAAGQANGIMENLTSLDHSGALNRIDAVMLITQAIKNNQ